VTDRTDYSPVVEETGDAEKRREGRKWKAFLWGAHAFWIYALLLGAIVAIFYVIVR
jgi:choline-glycine betaine transporter